MESLLELWEEGDFAARIKGYQMEPEFHEGDLVVFSRKKLPLPGDVCLVKLMGGNVPMLRKVIIHEDHVELRVTGGAPSEFVPKSSVLELYKALWKLVPANKG